MSRVISSKVYKEMKAAILSGYFKPRERLIEKDLIARYRVSRTVIREVLKKLEAKGLVRTIPYRGAVVADLTVDEIEEIYFVRALVEKAAAKLVIKNIRPQEIKELKKVVQETKNHLRQRTERMIEKDGDFHRAIFRTCRNQVLYDIIDLLRTKSHIVGYNAWSIPERIEQSIREHEEIMRAIEKREWRELERLIVKHLTYSKNSYLAQLKGTKNYQKKAKESKLG